MNKQKKLILIGAGVLVLSLAVSLTFKYQEQLKNLLKVETKKQKIVQEAINYINKELLTPEMGEIKLLEPAEEVSGLYRLKIKIEKQNFEGDIYLTKDGKYLFLYKPVEVNKEVASNTNQNNQSAGEETIGSFSVSKDEICYENGKPMIYFFGTSGCPHCRWEHPIVSEVASKFVDYISYKENMDSMPDEAVFEKYSTGGVPTIVLGCRYFRVGSGESIGEEKEKEVLSVLICKLTNNQPAEICQPLISQIEQVP